MTFEILLMLVLIGLALVLFVRETFPIEVTAFGLLAVLLMTGLVSVEQAISGFSNKAVIAIGALFVLGHAVVKSGILEQAVERLGQRVGERKWLAVAVVLSTAALLSGFLNNTAVVAIFIPLTTSLCHRLEISPSKALMPLSYASILGGTLTLIGTSTNLLVSSILEKAAEPPFAMFEFSALGVVYLLLGLGYVLLFGRRLLPERVRPEALTRRYRIAEYLTELQVPEASALVGKSCREAAINERYGITVLAILRQKRRIISGIGGIPLRGGDLLIVEGAMDDILRLRNEQGVALLTDFKLSEQELTAGGQVMAEGLVAPHSSMIGYTLKELDFRRRYGGFVLAIQRLGATLRHRVARNRLRFSDLLLILIPRDRLEKLRRSEELIILSEVGVRLHRESRWWLVLIVLPAVVLLAALGVVEITAGALLGVVLLLATRALSPDEAYRAVDWSVIFLIAAFVPVGEAIISTGTASYLAMLLHHVADLLPPELGPPAMLALVYLLTSLLTQIISNNAAAIIMAPIAFGVAAASGVNPRPFLIAVCFAASAEFMTPFGYQTNLMVYAPGGYRFLDYTRMGAPLNLLFWLTAALLIPRFWPL